MTATKEGKLEGIQMEGSATAPIISFDEAPVFGLVPGIGRVTLAAYVQDYRPDGSVFQRQVAVAHLRGNANAYTALANAIAGMALLDAGGPKPEGPTN
ncbi:hypothetical protein BHAOGJBA_1728 [Methylobacterium hispanicum]|uniref:Uncharacterized protein n=1 Tax=Methylobacterium hispanicum TaxID=270350 RepID=A0AAV4ZK85_9HYPH|nr:hypothetical protein BHAOGJBA_1728 [Methylobacterium hispanicum]